MNNLFHKRVKSAAVAAWWVVLIAVVFILVQWIAYLVVMHARPAWLLSLWGPNIDWPFVQSVWFWMVAVFKLCIWLLALTALWLSFWACGLKRHEG
ncbi:MAG: hypothetical protein ABFC96_08080 [Thermoguttaceae bacterium]